MILSLIITPPPPASNCTKAALAYGEQKKESKKELNFSSFFPSYSDFLICLFSKQKAALNSVWTLYRILFSYFGLKKEGF